MQENKIGGKFYRILIDEVNDIWDRLSFWTKASDVEMNSGVDLESKLTSVDSNIDTVSSTANSAYSLADTANNTADVAKTTANNVQGQLRVGGTKFYFDYQGGKFGFNTSSQRGESTFYPFSHSHHIEVTASGGMMWEWCGPDEDNYDRIEYVSCIIKVDGVIVAQTSGTDPKTHDPVSYVHNNWSTSFDTE